MSNNLNLWKSVEKTDPQYTSQGKKGQYHFTSIAPVYQIKNATEQWGPFGAKDGWGIKIGSENISNTTIGETILINYDAVLYYPDGELPIHACEKLAYKTNGANAYLKVDEDARKKVVTNALTKGLSYLGFNADIFTGQFDDYDYLSTIKAESEIKKSENKEKIISEKQLEIENFVATHITSINGAPSKVAADGIIRVAISHLEKKKSIAALSSACDWGIGELKRTHEEKYNKESR